MENQNKKMLDMDDRPKGRKGIEEMLQRFANTDDDGEAEEKTEKIIALRNHS